MARDYIVNITGKDNLSATLKGIKQQLQDTTSSASGLEKLNRDLKESRTLQPLLKGN